MTTRSPLRSIKNQYLGVNAHLHSFWQATHRWGEFHNRHVGDLTAALRKQLLPIGYTAVMEDSLQIRRVDQSAFRPRSDVTIYDLSPASALRFSASAALSTGQAAVPLIDMLDEDVLNDKPYRAVAIYPLDTTQGDPVAWLELLSPMNKGHGRDASDYRTKRLALLEGGIVFVELDYLHETPPTFPKFPDYTAADPNPSAHPYRLVVVDPRPDVAAGTFYFKEFDVDFTIPAMLIPLNGDDVVCFDFGAVYRFTVEDMVYGLEFVDYAALPLNFDRYSADDQTRIARRMLAVIEAAAADGDIEGGPFAVRDLPLAEALALIARRTGRG